MVAQENQQNNFQVFYPEKSSPGSVCMVIHGLNLNPSRMQWIIDELLSQGAIVILVELWGHGNNPVAVDDSINFEEKLSMFKQVTWDQWINDTKPAMKEMNRICAEKNLPKHFVGFSLGALVGVSAYNEFDFKCDKYLLLAPAFNIKCWSKTAIGFMSLFPNKVIKSKAPSIYRENKGTPVAAYKALLKGIKKFNNAQINLDSCHIIVDKKDELISSKKLSRYARKNNYSIAVINKTKLNCQYCNVGHLIIDEESLGDYSTFVSNQIQSFFE